MSQRVMARLLPALATPGWERTFDDVRWAGLLRALGVHSMDRRRHHHRMDLATLLDFLIVDPSSPRSELHCLRAFEDELGGLSHTGQIRDALAVAVSAAFALSHAAAAD